MLDGADPFVRFRNVQKSYDGETLVVKNLNLEIEAGEFVTMLGPSGSGKTTALRTTFGAPSTLSWNATKAIVSQVGDTPDDALARLMSVGLNSVPAWLRPFESLSNGEQQRARLARALRDGAVLDDFGNQMDADATGLGGEVIQPHDTKGLASTLIS